MFEKEGKCHSTEKEVRLLFWLKAQSDIYGVHNSYNFMMKQRCNFFLYNEHFENYLL